MTRAVSVHGFRIHDGGAKTTDRITPFVLEAGWDIDEDEADYGFLGIWAIILFNGKGRKDVIKRIARAIKKADIIYAHSNGVNFVLQALDTLPKEYHDTKLVVAISGAANTKTPIPLAVKAMLVLYTPHDIWVRLSSYIPFNRWGRMGARGYLGDSPKVTSVMNSKMKSHSYWFHLAQVKHTWQYIYNFMHLHIRNNTNV